MKLPQDVSPHDGPPDAPGWWVIQVPTAEPYLVQHDGLTNPDIARLWQPSFKAWRLSDLTDTRKVSDVLTAFVNRPKVLWDVVRAMSFLRVASPWTAEGSGWVRHGPAGTLLGFVAPLPHSDSWTAGHDGEQGIQTAHRTMEEAQRAVDKVLAGRGFFLLD